jgi:hypothetical protein
MIRHIIRVVTGDRPIVLVCEPGTELEAKTRLARIGFDKVVGCLSDPVSAFINHPGWVDAASRLTTSELMDRMGTVDGLQIVDVRGPGETTSSSSPRPSATRSGRGSRWRPRCKAMCGWPATSRR